MSEVFNAPFIQGVWSICASPMHDFVDHPCVDKSDCVTEQVNSTQGFSLFNNPYSNTYNHD